MTDYETLHFQDQQEIVRLRRIIGELEERTEKITPQNVLGLATPLNSIIRNLKRIANNTSCDKCPLEVCENRCVLLQAADMAEKLEAKYAAANS